MPTCAPHMAHLLIRYGCDPGYAQLSQSRPHSLLLVPSMWEHTLCAQPLPAREVLVLVLVGTHNLADTDPRPGTGPFPKPRALVLPLVHFGQSKPAGHGHLGNADSDLMHHQFRLSLLQWNPGPARRNPTNIVSAACGKFHAVILQEGPSRTSLISSLCPLAIRTLLSCSIKTPSNLILQFSHTRLTPQAKARGGMVLLHCSRSLATPISLWITDCYFLLSTHPQYRGQEA